MSELQLEAEPISNSDSRVSELERQFEEISRELSSKTEFLTDIATRASEKLEKLRSVQVDLESERTETNTLRHLLSKERELTEALAGETQTLRVKLESEHARFEVELSKARDQVSASSECASVRLQEVDAEIERYKAMHELSQSELAKLNEEYALMKMELKSLRASISTKQADYNLEHDRWKREFAQMESSKDKAISEQRALIDQLSNSMSEAATQLMESQDKWKDHQSEVQGKDSKIARLEEDVSNMHQMLREKLAVITEMERETDHVRRRNDQLSREKEIALGQMNSLSVELGECKSTIAELEKFRTKSDVLQSNLVSELQSLPVINKRLESDCAFLRDDLRSCSEKIKIAVKETEILTAKLKVVEGILSSDQRLRVNERLANLPTGGLNKTEATALSENKRLTIEAMELRMRLVDSQAARDKAQAQLIEQSQLIAKLQRDFSKTGPVMTTIQGASPAKKLDMTLLGQPKVSAENIPTANTNNGEPGECKQQ